MSTTGRLAGGSRSTTEQPSAGGARQAQDPAAEAPRPRRAARASVPGGSSSAAAPAAEEDGKTSCPEGSPTPLQGGASTSPQQPRRERTAAGTTGPETGASSPFAAPVRARPETSAGASGHDSPPAGSRTAAATRLDGIPPWPAPPGPGDVLLQIRLSLPPVTESRARISPAEYAWIGGRKVKTKKAHGYKEPALAEYQETVGWLLRRCRVTRNDTDELGVYGVFHLGRNAGAADGDNLLKAIVDAGNGIAWRDDRQFVTWLARVVRGSADPHTDLVVYVAGDGPRIPGGAS